MSHEDGGELPQPEAPKQSSAGFAIAFFLIPLLLIILFGALARNG